jgi:N-acetylmuramoyl-L-alanine amidase
MKTIAAIAIFASVLAAQTGRSAAHNVTALRHWSFPDVTRVAIEVSGDFQFRTDRLHDPERVYFDILNARPRLDDRRFYTQDIGDKFVQRVRVAETLPGVTRVVLDLNGDFEVASSQLTNPNRLIIELRAFSNAPAAAPPAIVTPPVTASIPALPKPEAPKLEAPAQKAEIAAAKATVPEPSPVEPKRIPPALPPATPARSVPEEMAKAARHTAAGQNSLIRALGLKITRVVIDPGHGGHDQGTTGPHGLLEKDLVLDVAQRLGKLIEERMGSEVIYTRTDDTFVPLEGRTALANDKKADLFLSIHANSSPFPHVAGIETFYLNITGAKDALDVAARENASSQKSVFELQDIIKKITLHDKAEESREFAGRIQSSLFAFSARNIQGSRNRGVKSAPFVVLIGANMPSVLAEIGFISNAREETLLKKPDYRQKLAEALFRGVSRYADGLSHFAMAEN